MSSILSPAVTRRTRPRRRQAPPAGHLGAGDFGHIGTRLQIVANRSARPPTCARADKVLDVAAGNGNASLRGAPLRRGDGDRLRAELSSRRAGRRPTGCR